MKSKYDVIVAGSGPAGFAAAYYAAGNGADTLLIEKNPTIGGMLTTGHMGVFCGYASSGLFSEIARTHCRPLWEGPFPNRAYDVEEMRLLLFEKLRESGASLLCNAFATGVRRSGEGIEALEVHAKEGPVELSAEVYVDATGDGDVAVQAGESFDLGRSDDGKFQPMTLIFSVAGVDDEQAGPMRGQRQAHRETLRQYVQRGEVSELVGHVIIVRGYREGTYKVNMTNVIDLDGTKSEDLTAAEVACRQQQAQILRWMRKELPGFEQCYVASSADMIGVRSTRHIHGQYVLNEKDISDGTVFDDWVVSTAKYVWGTHNLYGPMGGAGNEDSRRSPYGPLPHDNVYTIPFRSLRPAQTSNLLLAGRCISGTFLAHSNYRVMPICMAMGQGAGTAAAMATDRSCALDELDIGDVQRTLLSQGVDDPAYTRERYAAKSKA
jgi:hypothetical protein